MGTTAVTKIYSHHRVLVGRVGMERRDDVVDENSLGYESSQRESILAW